MSVVIVFITSLDLRYTLGCLGETVFVCLVFCFEVWTMFTNSEGKIVPTCIIERYVISFLFSEILSSDFFFNVFASSIFYHYWF